MSRPQRFDASLHFVGIGGIGMSGIAEVFLNQGYRVSGSDLAESESTRRLAGLGARVAIGHAAENVPADTSVVVISSAVRQDNPEVVEARRRRVPVIARAEMLGELMRGKTGIAVAGAHGKTSTTSILATILTAAGLDPTLVIGGKVDSLGGNAKLGSGPWVVAEADESDGSFLHLPTTYAIVTNLDNDHLDHFGSVQAIEDAFVAFVAKVPFYGFTLLCGDDAGVKRILPRLTKPFLTYGVGEENDFRVHGVRVSEGRSHWSLICPNGSRVELSLGVPGLHNVLNASAGAAMAIQLGVDVDQVRLGVAQYAGVKRRFEKRWSSARARIEVIDDYGHHPTEILATLKAARESWPGGRVLVVFQPHRYSRTQNCFDDFLKAFDAADQVIITEIYPAGETPIPGISGQSLVEGIRSRPKAPQVTFAPTLEAAQALMLDLAKEGDRILCLGAGSITRLPDPLAQELEKKFRS